MLLRVGAHLPLKIERLSLGGEGVGRAGPLVVFVPYAAPGDTLEVEITETRARFARARPLQILEASSERTTPPCPYHFQTPGPGLYCGGCSWQHLTYEAQLRGKRQLVQETLERIGGVRGVTVKPALGMKDPWRYRNKVQQPVGWDGKRMISGFYAPFSHEIVPIEDCLVQPGISVAIINRAKALLQQHNVRAYDDKHHNGWIRHLLVRTAGVRPHVDKGSDPGRALLVFITRTPDFPHESPILQALAREFPNLSGIFQNVNPARTNVILGRQWRKLFGEDFIEEHLGALRFRLSPGSFFQVNTPQAEVLYNVTKETAGHGERLLDLYCGVGGIALWLADRFREVGGIDDVQSAIKDAEANAELNGIENVRFQSATAEQFLRGMDRTAGGRSLTVILDPPRAGCAPEVLKSLAALHPGTVVYVSCDPGTLARDVACLAKTGYQVQSVQPVDLFPHTAHIETVVKLIHA